MPLPMGDAIGPSQILMTISERGMGPAHKCRLKARPVMAYLPDDNPRTIEVLDTAKLTLGIALAL